MQVFLGDEPAVAMGQRMSQGISDNMAPRLAGAAALAIAILVAEALHKLPPGTGTVLRVHVFMLITLCPLLLHSVFACHSTGAASGNIQRSVLVFTQC